MSLFVLRLARSARRAVAVVASVLLVTGATAVAAPSASAEPGAPAGTGRTYTSPDGNTVTLRDSTILLSAADMVTVDDAGSTVLLAQHPSPALADAQVGQVLLAGPSPETPDGVLRRITARSTTPEGGVQLTTRPATFDDAFIDLQVDVQRQLTVADATASAPDTSVLLTNDGLTFKYTAATDHPVKAGGYRSRVEHRVEITGSAKFTPQVNMSLSKERVVFYAAVTPEVSVSASATTDLPALDRTLHLADLDMRVIVVMVGPVPITIHPQMSFDLQLTGGISGGVSAAFSYSQQLSAGFTATATGLTPIWDAAQPVRDGSLDPQAAATFKVALVPTLFIQIEEMAGPTLTVSPGLQVTVAPGSSPWWKIEATLDVEVGGRIQVLGTELAEGSLTLVERAWELASAPTAFRGVTSIAGAKRTPTRTTTKLTARVSTGVDANKVTWTLDAGSPEARLARCRTCPPVTRLVGPAAYLVAPKEAGDFTVVATPSSGQPARKTVVVRTGAPGKPTAPQALTATARYAAAAVSWRYPADDHDSRVTAYTLTATTSAAVPTAQKTRSITVSGGATGATLTGLAPKAQYVLTLAARNGVGTGPVATTDVLPLAKLAVAGPSNMETATADGSPADPGDPFGDLRLSGNGRYLFVLLPGASPLLPQPSELDTVLARKDRSTGVWQVVSHDAAGQPVEIVGDRYSVSDDGQRIAYETSSSSDPRLYLADLANGTRTDLTGRFPVARADHLLQLTLSGDGRTLVAGAADDSGVYFGGRTTGLYRWVEGQTGAAIRVTTCPWTHCAGWAIEPVSAGASGTAVSDDGRRVVFTASHRSDDSCGTPLTGTYLWDAATGKVSRFSPTPGRVSPHEDCVSSWGFDSATISGDGKILAFRSDLAGLHAGPFGRLVPVGPQEGGGRAAGEVHLSDDGRIAVYRGSTAVSMTPDQRWRLPWQVWACDRLTNLCTLVSDVPGSGMESYSTPGVLQVSDNGRLVAFRAYGEVVGLKNPDGVDPTYPAVIATRELAF